MKFSTLIRESYRTISENWALLVLISSLWTLLSMTMILAPPVTVGVFYCVRKLIIEEDAGVKDLFKGMRRFFAKGWLLGMAFLTTLVVLAYDTLWLVGRGTLWLQGLAIVPFTLLIALLLIGNYLFVFLVKEDGHIRKTIKKAFLLAFDNLAYTVALTVLLALVAIPFASTFLLAMTFLVGIAAVVQSHAVQQLLCKYDLEF